MPDLGAVSAYALAVEHEGFQGTVEEWLESLHVRAQFVDITIPASGWSGSAPPFTQTVAVPGLTASGENSGGFIDQKQGATAAQREAARNAMLTVGGQAAGQLNLIADGEKPTIDIPATVTIIQ